MKQAFAWAAGILDGEGCISIVRTPPGKRSVTEIFTLHVKVTMGHLPTLERLAEIMGTGTVQHHAARGPRINASYSWIVQSQKARDALMLLRPYMVTKAEEADVALEFLKLPRAKRGGNGGGKQMADELRQQREALYWKLRQLKPRWRFYEEKLRAALEKIDK